MSFVMTKLEHIRDELCKNGNLNDQLYDKGLISQSFYKNHDAHTRISLDEINDCINLLED